jgi:hypothetical protein
LPFFHTAVLSKTSGVNALIIYSIYRITRLPIYIFRVLFAVLLAVSSAPFRPHARPSWLAEEIYEDYDTVLAFLPETSLYPPAVKKLFSTQEETVCRLSDWAFTQGYAAVKRRHSSRAKLHIRCVY